METVGVEPTSRNIATQASTSVADIFAFRAAFCLSAGIQRASLIGLFLRPQAEDSRRIPLKLRPLPYHMGDGGRIRLALIRQLKRGFD